MTVSVDDAVAALLAEAERHEKEHESDFCVDTRVALVVFVMIHLGLELTDLGEIAQGFVAMIAEGDSDSGGESEREQWPETINCADDEQR